MEEKKLITLHDLAIIVYNCESFSDIEKEFNKLESPMEKVTILPANGSKRNGCM